MSITIQSGTIKYRSAALGSTPAYLAWFVNAPFTDESGAVHVVTDFSYPLYMKTAPITVADGVLTYDEHEIDATEDALINPNATYSLWILDTNFRVLAKLDDYQRLHVPSSPTTTTIFDIADHSSEFEAINPFGNSHTVNHVQKWSSTGFVDSSIVESSGAVSGISSLVVSGSITGGTFTGSGSGLTSIPNSALPSTISNKTFSSMTVNGMTVSSATLTSPVLNSPVINNPSFSGNVAYPGNLSAVGSMTASAFIGDGSGLYNLPSGVVTPNSLSSTGSVSLDGDTDANGVGVVAFTTRNLTRMEVGNAGRVGIGIPGDTGTSGLRAQLNVKGFDSTTAALKLWTSDTSDATSANFIISGAAFANPSGSRNNVQYGWGINRTANGGKEFANEASLSYNIESFWTGGPAAAAVEHYLVFSGRNGSGEQRVMMGYFDQDAPGNSSLQWNINALLYGDFETGTPWMVVSPGVITFTTTATATAPKIVTDNEEPALWKGTQSYPFVNADAETEIGRELNITRFNSMHDTNDPTADYVLKFGPDGGPVLRFGIASGGGWAYSNNDSAFVNFSEFTKGNHRKSYSLGASAGSYSTLGSITDAGESAPLAFEVTLTEGNLHSIADAGSRVFFVTLPLYGTGGTWKEVLPLAQSRNDGGYNTQIKLDVKTEGDTTTLRIRRGATQSATTIYADIKVYGSTGAFTLSSATGTGATVAGTLETIIGGSQVNVGGVKILGAQGAAIADADGTLADITTKFNSLLARISQARGGTHGLIA